MRAVEISPAASSPENKRTHPSPHSRSKGKSCQRGRHWGGTKEGRICLYGRKEAVRRVPDGANGTTNTWAAWRGSLRDLGSVLEVPTKKMEPHTLGERHHKLVHSVGPQRLVGAPKSAIVKTRAAVPTPRNRETHAVLAGNSDVPLQEVERLAQLLRPRPEPLQARPLRIS